MVDLLRPNLQDEIRISEAVIITGIRVLERLRERQAPEWLVVRSLRRLVHRTRRLARLRRKVGLN
jgi:hypothetical protein